MASLLSRLGYRRSSLSARGRCPEKPPTPSNAMPPPSTRYSEDLHVVERRLSTLIDRVNMLGDRVHALEDACVEFMSINTNGDEEKEHKVEAKMLLMRGAVQDTTKLFAQTDSLAHQLYLASDRMIVGVERAIASSSSDSTRRCVVCMEGVPQFAFVPCGHLVVCRECVSQFVPDTNGARAAEGDSADLNDPDETDARLVSPLCPMCRESIAQVLRVYHM